MRSHALSELNGLIGFSPLLAHKAGAGREVGGCCSVYLCIISSCLAIPQSKLSFLLWFCTGQSASVEV